MNEKIKPTHTGRLKSLDKIIKLPAKYHPKTICGLYLKGLLGLIGRDIEVQFDIRNGKFQTEEIAMDEAYFEWTKEIKSIETDCWYLVRTIEKRVVYPIYLSADEKFYETLSAIGVGACVVDYDFEIISKMEAVK